jgi:hypothetical protein
MMESDIIVSSLPVKDVSLANVSDFSLSIGLNNRFIHAFFNV